MAWTGPQEDLLRKLAGEGLSGSQIAARLGKTRSAVCGKAWRFGLCLGGMPAAGGITVVRVRRKRAAANRNRKDKAQGRKQRPWQPLPVTPANAEGHVARLRPDTFTPRIYPPAPEHQRKSIHEIEERHCKWPIGDPLQAGFHFCGAEAVPGKPYCLEHCCVAFEMPKVRKPIHDPTPVHAFATEDA
jgi:GcrA cell cycle regulator